MEYLTPNSLILGRTGQEGDMHRINVKTHPWRRLRAVQAGVDKFWVKWSELAGPKLSIPHKWIQTERNVKIGDLVWIADQNALRGQFRLGRIVSTFPDAKGVPRDADVATCLGLLAPCVSRAWGKKRKEPTLPTPIVLSERCTTTGGADSR